MSPFAFRAVQTLNIGPEDQPNIDVRDGQLILTAHRDGDQIMITAPINSVLPATTTVKAETVSRRPIRRRPRIYRSTLNMRRGEDSPKAKLTEVQVREIKSLLHDKKYRQSYSSTHAMMVDLGNVYNVHYTTIGHILSGKTWAHVEV